MVLPSVVAKFPLNLMKSGNDPRDLFRECLGVPAIEYATPKIALIRIARELASHTARRPGCRLKRRKTAAAFRELMRANVAVMGVPLRLAIRVRLPGARFIREDAQYPTSLAVALSLLALVTPRCVVDEKGWVGLANTRQARTWLRAHTALLALFHVLVLRYPRAFLYALLAPQVSGDPERFLTRRIAVLWHAIALLSQRP